MGEWVDNSLPLIFTLTQKKKKTSEAEPKAWAEAFAFGGVVGGRGVVISQTRGSRQSESFVLRFEKLATTTKAKID